MWSVTNHVAGPLARVARSCFEKQVRSLIWKSTGEQITPEALKIAVTRPEFINNMTRVLPGPERIRVSALDMELEKDKPPRTVYEAMQEASERNTATRNICGWIDPPTKELRFLTYEEFFEESRHISMALREVGIQPKEFITVNWTNSKDFLETMYGATSMSMILQPLYTNLDGRGTRSIIRQGQSKIYICDNEVKARLIIERRAQVPSIRTLVVGGGHLSRDLREDAASVDLQLLTMTDFVNLGKNARHELVIPKPSDTFCVVYTSGTTGDPKGAMITHNALLQCYHSINTPLQAFTASVGEYVFCFLPTGHVFDMIFSISGLSTGATVMYWRGHIDKMAEDLRIIRPHNMPLVPRIMNRFYDKVNQQLASSWVKRTLFDFCFHQKKKMLDSGIVRQDTIYDRLVFDKIRSHLGGRVSLIVSSSAPLSKDVMEFFKIAIGSPVLEAYGSTEVLLSTITVPTDHTTGHVGAPVAGVEIKLVDVPELGYFAKDDVGEICVRSPFICNGYHNNEEATREAFHGGWYHTGDVGKWNEQGKLVILDRKKNIFKLAQGEYIAPDKVETAYYRLKLISEVIVEGRSDKDYCVAIVSPDRVEFIAWLTKEGFSENPKLVYSELCGDLNVRRALLEEMRSVGKANGLNSLQQVRNIWIEPKPFNITSGMLTATYKVKRNLVRKMFAQIIDDLYREGPLIETHELG